MQRLLVTLLCCGLGISTAYAAPAQPTEDNQWYYLIGGANSSGRIGTVNKRITIGGSAKFGLGYSCGKFDPTLSVSDLLEDVKDGAEEAYNAMVGAARSAIASLPALVLQRANPGLYDLFQNAMIKAEETFNISYKTCQQMEREIAAGENPYDGWFNISKQSAWQAQMGDKPNEATQPNIFKAEQAVEEAGGDNGIPWIDGEMRGGKGQPPLQPVTDASKQGFQHLGGSSSTTGSSGAGGSLEPRLNQVFADANTAADWITSVVGDQSAQTCEGCKPGGVIGVGLHPEFVEQYDDVRDKLLNLVYSTSPPGKTSLDQVAAPGVAVSRGVIEALRQFPRSEQVAASEKLASEIALARAIEKALIGRQILLAGLKQPEVQGYKIAADAVRESAVQMEKEIDNLLYEHRVRKEVVSNTAGVILAREEARRRAALVSPIAPRRDPETLQDGGISP